MTGTAISLGMDGVSKASEPILSHSRMSPLRRNSLLNQGNLLHLHQGAHLDQDGHLQEDVQGSAADTAELRRRRLALTAASVPPL